ncbi:MAG TPA: M20 family metallopeptidase [Thermoanaerobaculia bacterium]|nr:M20 family metallopeptidase [Thermoanaerobaculia bacterium]
MSASPAAALLARLRGWEGEMAALVAELAGVESPSLVPEAQRAVLDRLGRELAALGWRVRLLAGRRSGGQLYGAPPPRPRPARPKRGPGRGPAQLLLGHCDTVWPLGTLAEMPVVRRNGRLYGPGVYDMKGGLVQAVFALRALCELDLTPPATPVVFVNSDEEIGSGDSTRRIRLLARHVRRVFVVEPALGPEGRLKTRRKGAGHFTFNIQGRAAHAGLDPERGSSAILELAHLVLRLYALADPRRGITVNVGVVAGGMRANVVAPRARAEVDVRVLRWEDAAPLERALRGLAPVLPGIRLEVAGAIDRPPLAPTDRNRALWREAERAALALGLRLEQGTAGGASDGNTTSLFAPTLDGLGAVGDGAHAADEHLEIARLPERAALLAMLLLAPLAPETSASAGGSPLRASSGGGEGA